MAEAPGHWLERSWLALRQVWVTFQVPTMLPPHAVVTALQLTPPSAPPADPPPPLPFAPAPPLPAAPPPFPPVPVWPPPRPQDARRSAAPTNARSRRDPPIVRLLWRPGEWSSAPGGAADGESLLGARLHRLPDV